jgi:hypothetical protein
MSYREAILTSAVTVAFLIPTGLSFALIPPVGAADDFKVNSIRRA